MRALFLLLTIVALAAIPAAAQEAPKTEKLAAGAKAEKPAAAAKTEKPEAAAKAEKPTAAAKADKPASAAKAGKPAPAGALVNLNTATQAQLETLPGVGAKAAERILEYRQKNGQFKKVEEILEPSRS